MTTKRGDKLERDHSPTKKPARTPTSAPFATSQLTPIDAEKSPQTQNPALEIPPTISPSILFTPAPSLAPTSATAASKTLSPTPSPSSTIDEESSSRPITPSVTPALTKSPSQFLAISSPIFAENSQMPSLNDIIAPPAIDTPSPTSSKRSAMPSSFSDVTDSPVLTSDTLSPASVVSSQTPSLSSENPSLPPTTQSTTSAPFAEFKTSLSFQPSGLSPPEERMTLPTSGPSHVQTLSANLPNSLTDAPTIMPTTFKPTDFPTTAPTNVPTFMPTGVPPTNVPTPSPTGVPTLLSNMAATTPAPSSATKDDGFTTTLDLEGVPAKFQEVFTRAAAIWDSIIIGDLPDYPIYDEDRRNPELICDGDSLPEKVDDVYVCVSLPEIDGRRGILGSAGPTYGRFGEFVQTSVGYMQFDLADVKVLAEEGRLDGLILHEMAHVYGTGTLWALNGLVPDSPDCPYRYDSRASEEYRAVSGCDSSIPTETNGGLGTACLHWDEECFQSELMTGFNTGDQELSRMSIATLEDMGYEVDYSRADSFSADQLNPSCVCNSNSDHKPFQNKSSKGKSKPDLRSLQASEQARQQAIDYGKARLSKNTSNYTVVHKGAYQMDGRIFLADKVIVVLYFDGDDVKSVVVTPSSD